MAFLTDCVCEDGMVRLYRGFTRVGTRWTKTVRTFNPTEIIHTWRNAPSDAQIQARRKRLLPIP